jgi:hypothetical protein
MILDDAQPLTAPVLACVGKILAGGALLPPLKSQRLMEYLDTCALCPVHGCGAKYAVAYALLHTSSYCPLLPLREAEQLLLNHCIPIDVVNVIFSYLTCTDWTAAYHSE